MVYSGIYRDQSAAIKALFSGSTSCADAFVPLDIKKKMTREATIMCSLNHPNVLRVFGVVPERGWMSWNYASAGHLKTFFSMRSKPSICTR
jgi:serine/threonine protein kinase